MKSRINELLAEMEKKGKELKEEYLRLMDKYSFSFKNGKIVFNKEKKKEDKKRKNSLWQSFRNSSWQELLSIPFIYSMIVPVVIFDIFLFIYQQTAMRLYKIPLVRRKDYITYDRKELAYLNIFQKFNCLYCAYVNGFLAYGTEVAGRTERYWCPIKHAKKMKGGHEWQKYFADYGDADGFKEIFHKTEDFNINKD